MNSENHFLYDRVEHLSNHNDVLLWGEGSRRHLNEDPLILSHSVCSCKKVFTDNHYLSGKYLMSLLFFDEFVCGKSKGGIVRR